MKNGNFKEKSGITLIALVVTVIVILVLAGVSISMLTGENGILKRAAEAKEKTQEAQNSEQAQIDAILAQMNMQQSGEICNSPKLKTGMIPVKLDENKKTWVKASSDNSGKDWYDYSTGSKKWANVVTVKASGTKTRENYMNAEVGTEIAEDDITTMFVWIPRYAYKIVSGYHSTGNGIIDIKWLTGTTDATVDGSLVAKRTSETDKNYVVHPAFTNDTSLGGSGEEIEGFWVGKFESSNVEAVKDNANMDKNTTDENILYGQGDNKTVTIRPNVTSWRAISVSNIMTVSQKMTENNNIHGLSKSDTTTTMMQNSQWGAVAYLTQSEYGNMQTSSEDSGVWNNSYTEGYTYKADNDYFVNNYSATLTGIAGKSRDSWTEYYAIVQNKIEDEANGTITIESQKSEKEKKDGKYVLDEIGNNKIKTTNYTNIYYRYYTENGQKASTTRNIYGVYDVSGGAWEYMANSIEEGDAEISANGITELKKYEPKFATIYKGKSEDGKINNTDGTQSNDGLGKLANYKANKSMYGDAIWETSYANQKGNDDDKTKGLVDLDGEKYIFFSAWNGDCSFFPRRINAFFKRGGSFSDVSAAGMFFVDNGHGGNSGNISFRVVAL